VKYLSLNDQLYRYVCECRSKANDPILDALRKETEALGDVSRMQISREQGSFMTLLVAAIGARSAIEVGTFTGYSSLCIARGLADGGRLICIDESKEWTAIARRYWVQGGVENQIELRLGPAIPALRSLPPDLAFDFAFIDADKTGYPAYWAAIEAQIKALTRWAEPPTIDLSGIPHPVLIIQGSDDEMMHSATSLELYAQIPNSVITYYPNSAHGSFFQYPELFVDQANSFLNSFEY
jgi:caffeoyl-CoA O-methyltransferase